MNCAMLMDLGIALRWITEEREEVNDVVALFVEALLKSVWRGSSRLYQHQ